MITQDMFLGMKVYIREPNAKMRLSEKVTVTDEFRKMYNAWLADFFGFEKEEIIVSQMNNSIFMSSKSFAKLKEAAQ